MISENLLRLIPREVVDMIADYHDYEKHSRPQHSNNYRLVLEDIKNMSQFQCDEQNMSPVLAFTCWGAIRKYVSEQEYWELLNSWESWESWNSWESSEGGELQYDTENDEDSVS